MHTNFDIENKMILASRMDEKINLYLTSQEFESVERIRSAIVTFQLQSHLENRKVFVAMIILLEKLSNQRMYFILDKRTLSKRKTIKVGCRMQLRSWEKEYFLQMCCHVSLPYIIGDKISYKFPRGREMTYKLKRILFHSIFQSDDDSAHYYDLFDAATYTIEVVFFTNYTHPRINQLLLSHYGFNYVTNYGK